jgi:hypothetical protein
MDDQTDEKPKDPRGEPDGPSSGNRERLAAQSRHDTDPRLAVLLSRIVGAGSPDQHGTIELTLVVDGTVISGSAVSEEAWARRQDAQTRTSSGPLAALGLVQESDVGQQLGTGEEASANPFLDQQDRYVHFLEPVLLSGGTQVRMPATRVDLRKVSAWSIGRLPSGHE